MYLLILQFQQIAAQTPNGSTDSEDDVQLTVNVIFRINDTAEAGEIYCNNTRVLEPDTEYVFLNGTVLSCKYTANDGFTFDSWFISDKKIQTENVKSKIFNDTTFTALFLDRRDWLSRAADVYASVSGYIFGSDVVLVMVSFTSALSLVTLFFYRIKHKKEPEHEAIFKAQKEKILNSDTENLANKRLYLASLEEDIEADFRMGLIDESQYEELLYLILKQGRGASYKGSPGVI